MNNRIRIYIMTLFITMLTISFNVPKTSASALPVYTISPASKTYGGKMMNYSTYNSYTKNYYLLRSYLERLEQTKGGTLLLKKGTYTISNTLYVPSNVTIKFEDGAKLVKGSKTGTNKFGPSHSIFQLIRPSYSAKKGIYGKYNGEKNISFIGKGLVSIDMKNSYESIAIIAGHNQNVKIENITFKNMHSGHFIEMDATSHALISGNVFENSIASPKVDKEAINLDTPDRSTKGWSQEWSEFDKTANRYITIDHNKFLNLDRSVGTHKYSGGSYHDHITMTSNLIENMRNDAIRVMNWSNPVIEHNTIINVANEKGSYRGILASGAINPTIRYNTIEKAARPMQFFPWKNSGPGSQYAITYNKLSSANLEALKTNKVINTLENFIRINAVYNQYGNPSKIYVH